MTERDLERVEEGSEEATPLTISQNDFTEEQWRKLEAMDLTSWTVDDSWECFIASCTHSQWHTEGLEALRGKIEVSDMLLLPMWAERTKAQYSMVAYLDDNVSDVLKPALGGGELISDHGCFPWPKKPFLAYRPSALLQRGSSENNIFMLDVYERKSDLLSSFLVQMKNP